LSGRAAHAIQYSLKAGEKTASGTFVGTVIDGSVVTADFRIGSEDASTLAPIANDILGSIRITVKDELTTKSFGPYSVLVPAGWEVSDTENPGGGRNIFLRAPSGVDVRFQTALQKRQEIVDTEVLRRVSSGFLVDGLKVLTARDMAAARRVSIPGVATALRFESATREANVLVFAYMQAGHMIFALRGAPPQYHGRDLAIAWTVMRSFGVTGADRTLRPDMPRVGASGFERRIAFYRIELDTLAPDGTLRPESSAFLALLPDGSAGVVMSRNGKTEELRGNYRVEGEQIVIEGQGLGRMTYRMTDRGETLRGEAQGDVLFRARDEETP
jgi:hypothetical protein